MNPPSELHDDLSAIAAHGSRSLRSRPVEAVIRRGRQRDRRRRTAAATAAVIALAGVTVTVQANQPDGPAYLPATAPEASASAAAVSPAPAGALTGRTPVTLRLTDGSAAPVVAGSDDDDRVLVDTGQIKQYPGEDNQARERWLLRPSGGAFAVVQAEPRAGREVCMAHQSDGGLRVRLCRNAETAQQFTVAPTADGQAYTLSWSGSPVRVGSDAQLAIGGAGPVARIAVAAAR